MAIDASTGDDASGSLDAGTPDGGTGEPRSPRIDGWIAFEAVGTDGTRSTVETFASVPAGDGEFHLVQWPEGTSLRAIGEDRDESGATTPFDVVVEGSDALPPSGGGGGGAPGTRLAWVERGGVVRVRDAVWSPEMRRGSGIGGCDESGSECVVAVPGSETSPDGTTHVSVLYLFCRDEAGSTQCVGAEVTDGDTYDDDSDGYGDALVLARRDHLVVMGPARAIGVTRNRDPWNSEDFPAVQVPILLRVGPTLGVLDEMRPLSDAGPASVAVPEAWGGSSHGTKKRGKIIQYDDNIGNVRLYSTSVGLVGPSGTVPAGTFFSLGIVEDPALGRARLSVTSYGPDPCGGHERCVAAHLSGGGPEVDRALVLRADAGGAVEFGFLDGSGTGGFGRLWSPSAGETLTGLLVATETAWTATRGRRGHAVLHVRRADGSEALLVSHCESGACGEPEAVPYRGGAATWCDVSVGDVDGDGTGEDWLLCSVAAEGSDGSSALRWMAIPTLNPTAAVESLALLQSSGRIEWDQSDWLPPGELRFRVFTDPGEELSEPGGYRVGGDGRDRIFRGHVTLLR